LTCHARNIASGLNPCPNVCGSCGHCGRNCWEVGDASGYSSITVIREDGSEATIENPAQAEQSPSDAQRFHQEDASDYAGLPAAEVDR
jgi:hypothetical protein